MNATKASIIITLFSCMGQGKNYYTRVSVNKIIKLLGKIHKIHVKRRWIFCCLRDLEDKGYITRKQRYANDHNGLISQIPSLIAFKVGGLKYLVKKKVTGAWGSLRKMIKWVAGKDRRWPGKKDFDDGSWKPEDPGERKRLNALLGGVTKELEG